MMRWLPLVLFFIYVYIEVSFFIVVADAIGVFLALIAIILTSLIGLSLIKSQGIKNLILMQQKMQQNEDCAPEMVKSTSLFLAGFFMLIPGFITDIIGAILLLPPVQRLAINFILPKVKIRTQFYSTANDTENPAAKKSNNEIIDGQFTRKDDE